MLINTPSNAKAAKWKLIDYVNFHRNQKNPKAKEFFEFVVRNKMSFLQLEERKIVNMEEIIRGDFDSALRTVRGLV